MSRRFVILWEPSMKRLDFAIMLAAMAFVALFVVLCLPVYLDGPLLSPDVPVPR